ncbi:hypothetical protein [Zhihengliuella sp.]|uniref:hypothetical protein n=1 Tax=Zhihengliuella sp. TaxID=1954483 RepID=UPI0028110D51|nr:hypothetical protein [Zhihengliuella sp.]
MSNSAPGTNPQDLDRNDVNAKSEDDPVQVPDEELKHQHDEQLVEEWSDESFPGSDPPSNY